MAYYLAFAGGGAQSGQYVTLNSRINIKSADDFSILIGARISANSNFYRPIGGDNALDTAPRVLILGGGTFRLYNTAGNIRSWATGVNLTTVETIEFRRVSGTLDLLINGVVQSGSITSNVDKFSGFQVVNANSSNASEVANDLYRLQFTINGALAHDYDPSASGGTGLVLTDIVGGNNGTLVNFPGDDSQWIFYGSTGTTSDVALTWPLFSVSAEQESFSNNVTSDGLIIWPLFSVAAGQDSQAPNYNADAEFSWPLFSASVSQDSTLPAYASDAAITWPLFSVSAAQSQEIPAGSAAVNISWTMFSASASQESTVPEFAISASLAWPMFAVSADSTQIAPAYDSTVAITWPMFSISALVGEFDYFQDPKAKFEIPALSRSFDIATQSRTFDI